MELEEIQPAPDYHGRVLKNHGTNLRVIAEVKEELALVLGGPVSMCGYSTTGPDL